MTSSFSPGGDFARTTIAWGGRWERFRGLADWRLHLAVLLAVNAAAYWWLW